MKLSPQIAENIVREVNAVIPQMINIMDATGVIIASSDLSRVGTLHDGAVQIIKDGLNELVIHSYDEFFGAKPGVNYPIIMQGACVGVLGITGDYADVSNNALIIKRMTELLLLNAYNAEQHLLGENIRNRYIDEWLTGDVKNITADFVERGRLLNIDITIPRRFLNVALYPVPGVSALDAMVEIDHATEEIARYILHINPYNFYFKDGGALVCAVTEHDDEALARQAEQILSLAESRYPLKAAVGIDAPTENYIQARQSYNKAKRACNACMRTHAWSVRFYNDLNMELISGELDDTKKLEYIRRIFRGMSRDEIVEAVMLLENYYDAEGSLDKCAKRLFLHKNTAQYRLKRIAERTGYDPRSIRRAPLYYLAIYFYRDMQERF
ncbi:MAG: hypothetical protein GX417_07995 [Clostridiales bacterium]|nr:hypothetical protein [Clostridiales bacterium]